MKRFVFLLLVGLLVLLVACVEGQEQEVVDSTAVRTPPPTLEPTVTETAKGRWLPKALPAHGCYDLPSKQSLISTLGI